MVQHFHIDTAYSQKERENKKKTVGMFQLFDFQFRGTPNSNVIEFIAYISLVLVHSFALKLNYYFLVVQKRNCKISLC